MRKVKEKTAGEKAVDVLFEGGVDATRILGQGGLLKELTKARHRQVKLEKYDILK